MVIRISCTQNRARRLIHSPGRVVDQSLANRRNQRFIRENGANFLLGDVHRLSFEKMRMRLA
jgi:hypothetical protein